LQDSLYLGTRNIILEKWKVDLTDINFSSFPKWDVQTICQCFVWYIILASSQYKCQVTQIFASAVTRHIFFISWNPPILNILCWTQFVGIDTSCLFLRAVNVLNFKKDYSHSPKEFILLQRENLLKWLFTNFINFSMLFL
jgi:hypothetical protein